MKKRKQKNNLGMIIGILIIILAALGLMFAATIYYQNSESTYETETTTQRQPIKIPDITNPPPTQEATQPIVPEVTEPTGTEPPVTEPTETEPTETQSSEEKTELLSEESSELQSTDDDQPIEQDQSFEGEPDMSQEDFVTEQQSSTEETMEQTIEEVDSMITDDKYREYVYQGTIEKNGSHIVDLTAYTAPTANELIAMIESYTLPERTYLDGAARTEGDFSYPIKRRNLGPIHDPVELRYGILADNAFVRAFPTWQKLSNGTSADDPDALQETMLPAGEGVIVLHQSADQIWSFVQSSFYYGWIETAEIAFCDKETMDAFIAAEDFAVITDAQVEIAGVKMRMGTKLPIAARQDGACLLKVPQADSQGNLTILEVSVSTKYISDGYLPLDAEAIAVLAEKLLGTNYGWGDSNAYMDCSSTLRAVYNCFGLALPRNTSWMPNTGLKVTDLREMGIEEKKQVITSLAPGSLLLINGHVMMYIGQKDGVESMLHNVTQYLAAPGSELVKPKKCVITPITICNSAGNNYLELYRYAISVDWDQITQ